MVEQPHRLRIDDLASVGEELSEEHLRLVSGASGKKKSGSGRGEDGTSTAAGTMVTDMTVEGFWSEWDGDVD